MPSGLLIGLVFIPSMIFAYVVLTTFYGANKAYLGISWFPLASSLLIGLMTIVLGFRHLPDEWWRGLAVAIARVSMIQVALGIVLLIRALRRRKGAIGVSFATLLSASPLLLRFIR